MIERHLIQTIQRLALYQRKPGTQGSYYWQQGCKILPNRLSITKDQVARVERTGRNLLHPISGQLLGTFTKKEESPLKVNSPFVCRTQIWQHPDFPNFIGYGSIGISNEQGRVDRNSDTGDLVILEAEDPSWERISISYFPALIGELEDVMKHLSKKGAKAPSEVR